MNREIKLLAMIVAGLVAARVLVVTIDSIAESVERRGLYR